MTHSLPGRGADADALLARLSRRLVLRVSIGSLVLFSGLAWLIAISDGRSVTSLFRTGVSPVDALVFALAAGGAAALGVTAAVLYVPALRGFREFLRAAYGAAHLSRADMLLVAINAGVGEELLFRGALQPLLGLGWTSVVFALLHSGIPRSRGVAVFALYVFVMSLGLGALYEYRGLAAAMVAHGVFDFAFLVWSARVLLGESAATPAPTR